ncbi:hypothetical protein SAMN05216410_2540 [Sanguibacter gelidistatuariae]|uniref:Lipoprotein n=1 Tax=Sanguibacter gelidistatuariae TaxID=1814289 RepID=A0A1G6QIP7_9MICO|nr:hypothetical protein [Sanguibacter gelidistatuariae]SDC91596.1 hypothetical protein SAMN05216410_2540 [Sanguibacter gelidistatuariae]
MNTSLGGFVRVATTVVALAMAATVLAGCGEAAPLLPLDPVAGAPSEAQAQAQADRLVLMLAALEQRFTAEPTVKTVGLADDPEEVAPFLSADATVDEAPDALSRHFNLASQPLALIEAHAAYLEDIASAGPRPVTVDVEATDVDVVGTSPVGDPVARVVVETTYRYATGPDAVTSAEYAVSWASAVGGAVDAHGTAVQGPYFDGVRLTEILPLYDDAGRPALDSGLGEDSPSNAVHGYVRALTHGSSANVSALEGTVRSSEDFRAVLRDRLKSVGRYSVVEVPGARMGDTHVMFVIQEGVPGALRLDVTIGRDGPTVVPRL